MGVHKGTVNNPTGKGLHRNVVGETNSNGAAISAGHALTKMMCKVMVEDSENGKLRVENMCRAIMKQAEAGDVQSANWYADRILGKAPVAVTLGGDPDNPIGITLIERLIVDPKAANTNGPGLQASA